MRVGQKSFPYVAAILLAILFVVLPLERIGSIGFAGVTLRISQVIILIIGAVTFARLTLRQATYFLFSWPLYWYVGFLAIALLSLWVVGDWSRGLLIVGLYGFMLFVVWVIEQNIRTPDEVQRYTSILLLSSLAVCVFGFFQFFGDLVGLPQSLTGLSDRYVKAVIGIPRIQSTFIEPLYFANFLLIPLSVSAGLFFSHSEPDLKKRYLVLSVIFFSALILTISKGGIMAAAVSIGMVVAILFRRLITLRNVGYGVVVCSCAGLLIWSGLTVANRQPDVDVYIGRAYEVVFGGGSILERQESYSVALDAFSSSPIWGIGSGSFGSYFSGYPVSAPDYGWPIVNNQYLEILAENGLVGFLFFAAFIISLVGYGIVSLQYIDDSIGSGLLAGYLAAFVGIIVQYATFSTLYIMHIWVLIGMMLVTIRAYRKNKHGHANIF